MPVNDFYSVNAIWSMFFTQLSIISPNCFQLWSIVHLSGVMYMYIYTYTPELTEYSEVHIFINWYLLDLGEQFWYINSILIKSASQKNINFIIYGFLFCFLLLFTLSLESIIFCLFMWLNIIVFLFCDLNYFFVSLCFLFMLYWFFN